MLGVRFSAVCCAGVGAGACAVVCSESLYHIRAVRTVVIKLYYDVLTMLLRLSYRMLKGQDGHFYYQDLKQ
jgi:hypothetical protein